MPPTIPALIRSPGTYGVTDPSLANTATDGPKPIYLIGEYSTLGSGKAANTPYLVGSADEVAALAGAGSYLARMAVAFFAGGPRTVPIYAVAVQANAGGTAARGKITVTGTASADSVRVIRIAGQDIEVAISSGDGVGTTAAAIDEAINALESLPITSTVAAGVVTMTARHKGVLGNRIRIEFDPDGAPDDNVTLTLTNAMGGLAPEGAGETDFGSAAAAIASRPFDLICLSAPYLAVDWLADFHAIFNDATGRWAYNKRLDGHLVIATQGDGSGGWDNGKIAGIADEWHPWLDAYGLEGVSTGTNAVWGTPPWEMAGALAASIGQWLQGDISRACEERTILESADWHMDPPSEDNRHDWDETEALIRYGYAAVNYGPTGVPMLYTSNTVAVATEDGAPSNAWQQMRVRFILSRFGATQRARIRSQFQSGGSAPITSASLKAMKATCCTVYREFCDALQMSPDSFAEYSSTITVTQDSTDPNRVNIVDQPQPTGTASVITIRNSFKLL
jgi:phage tail sheath gpL-like